MADVLRRAINQKKQFLKTKLLLSEFYQGRGEQLADYTLSELEKEYKSLQKMKKRSDNRYKEVSLLKSGLFCFDFEKARKRVNYYCSIHKSMSKYFA